MEPGWGVSVVIPTHDRRQWVQRAVDSVLEQTRAPLEVIVVDDGSTDGTEASLQELGSRRDLPCRVEVLRQEQQGVSAARNAGIAAACGEWIALLDSDDWWQPRKLEAQIDALRAAPEHWIVHCDETWIRRGNQVLQRRVHAKRGGELFHDSLGRCVISPSAVVLHRQLLLEEGGFDESLPACEDYDLWLRLTAKHAVVFVDEPLVVKTGGHDDQLSKRYVAMDRFRLASIARLLDSGRLNAVQESAARACLRDKLDVLVSGARRRGHHDRADEWARRWSRYGEAAVPARPTRESVDGSGSPRIPTAAVR